MYCVSLRLCSLFANGRICVASVRALLALPMLRNWLHIARFTVAARLATTSWIGLPNSAQQTLSAARLFIKLFSTYTNDLHLFQAATTKNTDSITRKRSSLMHSLRPPNLNWPACLKYVIVILHRLRCIHLTRSGSPVDCFAHLVDSRRRCCCCCCVAAQTGCNCCLVRWPFLGNNTGTNKLSSRFQCNTAALDDRDWHGERRMSWMLRDEDNFHFVAAKSAAKLSLQPARRLPLAGSIWPSAAQVNALKRTP